MVNDDALFCIYQDKTLRHDVVKLVPCEIGSLKSVRENFATQCRKVQKGVYMSLEAIKAVRQRCILPPIRAGPYGWQKRAYCTIITN